MTPRSRPPLALTGSTGPYMHIRFRKSFASYEQGKGYQLPEELAQSYINAGVAEVVDHVPIHDAVVPEDAPEQEAAHDEPEHKHKRKSK